nr:hypothetical protein [Tanacetum cinerariifolium]
KRPGKNTPQCYTKPLDSLKNWNNRFFWVDECVFPTVMDWRTNASGEWYLLRRGCEGAGYASYPHPKTTEDVTVLGRYKSQILSGGREMDLFSLIRAPNPTKMDEPATATDSSGVLSAVEKSSMDFAHEDGAFDQGTTAPEVPPPEDVPATAAPEVGQSKGAVVAEPPVARESRKKGHDRIDVTAPPKSLRRYHAGLRPSGAPADVSDPDPLSFADAPSHHPVNVAQSSQGVAAAEDPESENVSSPAEVGSPGSVYRPKCGVTNGSLLDTPEACQDLVDHAAPPGYFSELRHMHNEDFLGQYNINLARQVAMGSQLRLRFEHEAKLLRKSVAQVALQDQRIQARESEIKNLEALLETEVGMQRAAKEKSAGLSQELERMRVRRCSVRGGY